MTTLQSYITTVRRLLHDANANFWTDQELTDYINDARNRLVRDTGVNRVIQNTNIYQNQEVYDFSSLPRGSLTLDIVNFNVYWGNSRVPLQYQPWTQFNSQLRYWQNYIGMPVAYSIYGSQKFYVGPTPDQTYQIELDTIVQPIDLVNLSDVETIPLPYTEPVPYYAAGTAKYKEQSYGEAEIFKQEYLKKAQNVLATSFQRRIPNIYSQVY
jgi:hypothetical protein